jgi:hypothetical protein
MTQRTNYADPRARKARHLILCGLVCVCVGAAMLFSPAWLGRGIVSACVAGVGFLCGCVGLSMIFHAAWDWRRGK